jgi:hypothetical protein
MRRRHAAHCTRHEQSRDAGNDQADIEYKRTPNRQDTPEERGHGGPLSLRGEIDGRCRSADVARTFAEQIVAVYRIF